MSTTGTTDPNTEAITNKDNYKKLRKVRVWLTDKDKPIDTKTKYMYEKPVTINDLDKPFEFDVYADFVSDGAAKKKVANISFNYDGTIPEPDTNKKPIAKAGNDQTVKPKDTVTLDGSQSSDPDGTPISKYDWTQINGSTKVNLVFNSNIPTATFIAPELGGVVQPPPTSQLNAKLKELIGRAKPGSAYTIDGSQSQGDIIQWTILQDVNDPVKVALQDTTSKFSKTFIMPDTDETLHFTLSVTDGTDTKTDSQTVAKEIGTIPSPDPTTGTLLYDSNTHGKWNNGVKRTVTKTDGSYTPDGKGLSTAASGSPRLIIDGNGIAHLEADAGHGRIYIKAKNYNARLEFDFMFEDTNIDNISFKMRSRHQEGGDCANRFGGFGGSIDRVGGTIGFKTEECHNIHSNSIDGKLPTALKGQTWYRAGISVYDSPDKKQVNLKFEIDYKDGKGFVTALTGSHKNPKAPYVDEASFAKDSYIWLRINNEKTGRVAFKDVKMTKIETTTTGNTPTFTPAADLINIPQFTTATGTNSETYTFRLTVTDTKGATASDDVNVIVSSDGSPPPPPPPPTDSDLKVAMFADTEDGSAYSNTAKAVSNEKPDAVIFGGDTAYNSSSASKWIGVMDTNGLTQITQIAEGNHENSESEKDVIEQQIEKWRQDLNPNKLESGTAKWLSAKQIKNLYSIVLNSQDLDYKYAGRTQSQWFEDRLKEADSLRTSGQIDWIIVTIHKPQYTLKTNHAAEMDARKVYQQLCDQYQVDFVYHGHNHDMQLWLPMSYDAKQLFQFVSGTKIFDFSKPHGQAYIINGAGGHEHTPFKSSEFDSNGNIINKNVQFANDKIYGYCLLLITGKSATLQFKSSESGNKLLYESKYQK